MPIMYEQFSVRPEAVRAKNQALGLVNPDDPYNGVIQVDEEDMYTGMGIVRGVPGPVFSIASFTGGMALKDKGSTWQVLGCLIGTIAIFLPSALLVLFFYPIWHNLKKYAAVYRSLEGINAAVMGIMIGSTFYIMKDIAWVEPKWMGLMNLTVMLSTLLFLVFSRIPAPVLVIAYVILGWLF